jgi:hypothetical protein
MFYLAGVVIFLFRLSITASYNGDLSITNNNMHEGLQELDGPSVSTLDLRSQISKSIIGDLPVVLNAIGS